MFKEYLSVDPQGGVFSSILIPPRRPIIEFKGPLFKKDTIENIDDVIQVGHDAYLGMSGAIDDKFNHCCHPTAYLNIVGNRYILHSLYQIKPNMEISYDYSLSNIDPDLNSECDCNHIHCRKQITDYYSLPEDIRERYETLSILPMYMKYNFFQKFK